MTIARLGEDFRGPDGRVGYLLRQTQHALRLAMDRSLREVGITTPQYQILGVVGSHPAISGVELAQASMLSPQSVNEVVLALDRLGFVERTPDPDDRRVRRVSLTARGEEVVRLARERVAAIEGHMVSGLTAAEQRTFRTWLVGCAVALEELAEPAEVKARRTS